MVEDRRTLGLAESIEEAERLFIEDFDTWDMTGYYLYSKLLRSGVSGHIGTGGTDSWRPTAVGGPIDLPGAKQTLRIKCRAVRGELNGKNKYCYRI
jgi:hypothetical protein